MRGDKAYIGLAGTELLLALLILAVLSSLLLPALTQRAASARQAVCLANIRSIAQALRMYLDDNDGLLPPSEHNPDALAYFNTRPGGADENQWDPTRFPNCCGSRQSNPYLRWSVILDEYLLTRDVWRCPDARLEGGASFISGGKDRLAHLRQIGDCPRYPQLAVPYRMALGRGTCVPGDRQA